MKYEWKKADREVYLPKGVPALVSLPPFLYFSVSGRGDPSGLDFHRAVEMLYTASYSLKMLPKKHPAPKGWYDYSVFPLEAAWDCPGGVDARDDFVWEVMIRQPDFLTPSVGATVLELCRAKKPDLPWQGLSTTTVEEGQAVQILHIGPYAEERASFDLLDAYCLENGFVRRGDGHKEIYLNDPNRTRPEKMKTVLRYWIGPKGQKLAPVSWGRHG